jgi:FkbM family methyltransferase
MTTLRLRHALARALGPAAYHPFRRMVVLFRYYARVIYDRDLLFVRHLGPQPLLIDVGANAGQSALCMAMLRPDARIISFEANADNIADLAFVRRILGARYTYHHVGLSDRNGSAVLKVPVVGQTAVPGEASLEEFDSSIEDRIGKISKIARQEVTLETFDSFKLLPDFVKIDVQGHELEVVQGMTATLSACRPVLLLEKGLRFREIQDYLSEFRYEICWFDQKRNKLVLSKSPDGINYFAVPLDQRYFFSIDLEGLPSDKNLLGQDVRNQLTNAGDDGKGEGE